MTTPGCSLSWSTASMAPAGVTQTGHPGPDKSCTPGASSPRSPAWAMAMVWVPQISMMRRGFAGPVRPRMARTRAAAFLGRRKSASLSGIDGLLDAGKVLFGLLLGQLFNGKAGVDHGIVAGLDVRDKIDPQFLGQAAGFAHGLLALHRKDLERYCQTHSVLLLFLCLPRAGRDGQLAQGQPLVAGADAVMGMDGKTAGFQQ